MDERDLPEPEQAEPRRSRVSWVWLVPVVALAISVLVVWQTYSNQGPVIIVSLPSASGVEAGETPLRFRDVEVGLVEDVTFATGLEAVEAHIRLDSEVAQYVDADAQFWLVEPQVTTRGVSGLSTVLSGVYLEGTWDGEIGRPAVRFEALENTPLSRPGEEGTRIVLRSRDGGQLSPGAPVLYNGIEVGRLGEAELSEDGTLITMDAFIEAPHDQRLTTNTRFWDISGISIDLNTSGLSVNFESLASLVEGGVAFEALVTGGESIEPGQAYNVYTSRAEAQRSVFEAPVDQALDLAVILPADDLRLVLGRQHRTCDVDHVAAGAHEAARAVEPMQGEIPSPIDIPTGCRFRTRCPMATDLCARVDPPLTDVGGGHLSACHFAGELAQQSTGA